LNDRPYKAIPIKILLAGTPALVIMDIALSVSVRLT
jgi:hypothetical protein